MQENLAGEGGQYGAADGAGEAGVPVALIPPQGYSPQGGAVILQEVDKILG